MKRDANYNESITETYVAQQRTTYVVVITKTCTAQHNNAQLLSFRFYSHETDCGTFELDRRPTATLSDKTIS